MHPVSSSSCWRMQPLKEVGIEPADKIPVRLGIILLSSGPSFKAQQEAVVKLLGTMRPQLDQAFVVTRAKSRGSHGWPKSELTWDSDLQAVASFVHALR